MKSIQNYISVITEIHQYELRCLSRNHELLIWHKCEKIAMIKQSEMLVSKLYKNHLLEDPCEDIYAYSGYAEVVLHSWDCEELNCWSSRTPDRIKKMFARSTLSLHTTEPILADSCVYYKVFSSLYTFRNMTSILHQAWEATPAPSILPYVSYFSNK